MCKAKCEIQGCNIVIDESQFFEVEGEFHALCPNHQTICPNMDHADESCHRCPEFLEQILECDHPENKGVVNHF